MESSVEYVSSEIVYRFLNLGLCFISYNTQFYHFRWRYFVMFCAAVHGSDK